MSSAKNRAKESGALEQRAFLHPLAQSALSLLATLLAFAPAVFPAPFATALGLFFVFLYPGYLLDKIFKLDLQQGQFARLPIFFVFSLAIWAIPATLLQLVGANWFAFRVVFVVTLWVLTVAAFRQNRKVSSFTSFRTSSFTFDASRFSFLVPQLILALVGLLITFLVWRGPRDADDWGYLQVTQQLMGSAQFQILAASEARYSIRYAFHVWIFLQAFLGEWLNADVAQLVRDVLPALLTPLALLSFYAWAKTFFGNTRAALVAVAIQLLIYVTSANADGWGRGFFVRSAQDKFLVWLIILPIAFSFAWNFLREGKLRQWFAYGVAVIAGLWVHPVSLFLLVLALGGFALFNFLARAPFARKRWLLLLLASAPALLSPLVIRATTLPSVFRVDTPDVEAYVRLSEGRLLFQPPFYIADPALVANAFILLSLFVLMLTAARVRQDARVQFLWGSTLVPLALVFNPFTARLLGEMLTPWQLWRITWLMPAAFVLTDFLFHARAMFQTRRVAFAFALVLALGAAFALTNMNLARSFRNFSEDHALAAPVQDMLLTLKNNLDAPANVLLPRDITRYAPAYTHRAVVLSNDAQKPEDTRGQQIDRFYEPNADPKFLNAFLDFWEIDFVVVENGTLQDAFLKTHPRARFLYANEALTLYELK